MRPRIFALVIVLITGWFSLPILAAGDDALPPIDKKDLRYDGKDFAYWQSYLMTELKEERQLEALKALGAFAVRGYGREAAAAVVQFAERYDINYSKEISDTVSAAGADGVPVVIDGLKRKKARPFCRWHLSSKCPCTLAHYRALLALLSHDDWQVRVTAASVLGTQEEGRAEWLSEEKTRRSVADALGKIVADRRFGADGDRDAVRLLGSLGKDAAASVPALLFLLEAPPPKKYSTIPEYAALALGEIGADADKVVPALIRALESKESDLRSAAARGLGKFGPQARKAAPRLWAVVNQRPEKSAPPTMSSPYVVVAAKEDPPLETSETYVDMVIALSLLGEPPAKLAPRLASTLDWHMGPDRRVRVLDALARMGPEAREALPALERMSDDRDDVPQARDRAIRAIRAKDGK
jgi:HEAT repeat protein